MMYRSCIMSLYILRYVLYISNSYIMYKWHIWYINKNRILEVFYSCALKLFHIAPSKSSQIRFVSFLCRGHQVWKLYEDFAARRDALRFAWDQRWMSWISQGIIKWDPILGGDQTMQQIYVNFEGLPWSLGWVSYKWPPSISRKSWRLESAIHPPFSEAVGKLDWLTPILWETALQHCQNHIALFDSFLLVTWCMFYMHTSFCWCTQ